MPAIPSDLAAEIEAHPGKFRPNTPRAAHVLVLAVANHPGAMTTTFYAEGLEGQRMAAVAQRPPNLSVSLPGGNWTVASAWARVGSVHVLGSPRPAAGDRILILEAAAEGVVWRVGQVTAGRGDAGELLVTVDDTQDRWYVTRWAILPPADPAPRWAIEALAEAVAQAGHGPGDYDGTPACAECSDASEGLVPWPCPVAALLPPAVLDALQPRPVPAR